MDNKAVEENIATIFSGETNQAGKMAGSVRKEKHHGG
jgi:hypothetical protein